MLAYGFSAFFAGVIGTITMFSIPGDQLVLSGVSGLLTGSGAMLLLIGALVSGK